MKWNKWFRLYALIASLIVGYVEHQNDPALPLICCFGFGFFGSLLLPGLVMSFLLVGRVGDTSLVVSVIGSAIFWAIVAAICNRKPKAPARAPAGRTVIVGWRRARRVRWEGR